MSTKQAERKMKARKLEWWLIAIALVISMVVGACGPAPTPQPTFIEPAVAAPTAAVPVFPVYGGETLPNDESYDSMFFENYGVNPFIDTEDDHLSTFAMDVDTASYTIVRRYVNEGHLPPKDAIRVEEFIRIVAQ